MNLIEAIKSFNEKINTYYAASAGCLFFLESKYLLRMICCTGTCSILLSSHPIISRYMNERVAKGLPVSDSSFSFKGLNSAKIFDGFDENDLLKKSNISSS